MKVAWAIKPSSFLTIFNFINAVPLNGDEEISKTYRDLYKKPLDEIAKKLNFQLQSRYFPKREELTSTFAISNLIASFNGEFDDSADTLKLFSTHVLEIAKRWNPAEYFAPYTAIVQSSGFGKSRLVCEYGRQKSFTFYVCLRSKDSTGYPRRSHITHSLKPDLSRLKSLVPPNIAMTVYYICFFASCLWELPSKMDYKSFLDQQLRCESEYFFAGKQFWEPIRQRWQIMLKHCLFGFESHDNYELIGGQSIGKALFFLNMAIGRIGKLPNPILFIFDEANALVDASVSEKPYLHYMCCAMSHFPNHSSVQIVGSFLDTFASISTFLPSEIPDPSLRYITGIKRFDSFLAFGFPVATETVDPDKDPDTSFLVFGRYLWRSLSKESLLPVAAAKLLCQTEGTLKRPKDEHFLALLGPRIGLFLQSNQTISFKLVRSHCATLEYADSSRDTLFTYYPPEPLLAEASAYVTGSETAKATLGWLPQIRTLLKFTRNGLVDAGNRGELVARVLLLMARDRSEPLRRKSAHCFAFTQDVNSHEASSDSFTNAASSTPAESVAAKDSSSSAASFSSLADASSLTATSAADDSLIADSTEKASAYKSKPSEWKEKRKQPDLAAEPPKKMIKLFDQATSRNKCLSVLTLRNFLVSLGGEKIITALNLETEALIDECSVNFTHFSFVTFTPTVEDARRFYASCTAIFCLRDEPVFDLMIPFRHGESNYSFLLIQVKNYDLVASGNGIDRLKTREAILERCQSALRFGEDDKIILIFMQVGYNQQDLVDELGTISEGNLHACILKGISPEIFPFIQSKEEENVLKQLSQAWADPRALLFSETVKYCRPCILKVGKCMEPKRF
jgi:hypothetical protein